MSIFFNNKTGYESIFQLSQGPFFLIDEKRFIYNYESFQNLLNKGNNKFKISYSVKTNYIPNFLRAIKDISGNVEVVSDMELDLVKSIGFESDRIILNGPIKSKSSIISSIDNGITINIDSDDDLDFVTNIRNKHRPESELIIGIRLNYDVLEEGSRFGISIDNKCLDKFFKSLSSHRKINVKQIHAHFQARSLEAWNQKISHLKKSFKKIVKQYSVTPDEINFGGGMYGPMSGRILENFPKDMPSYEDYSHLINEAASEIQALTSKKITFYIEPGTALVADCIEYITQVYSVKDIGGKMICTVNGSLKDLAAHSGRVPTDILVIPTGKGDKITYKNLTIVGNTCLEKDIITKIDEIDLSIGDLLVFPYCGAYSVVMRPQFIHYMPPIYSMTRIRSGDMKPIKPKETINEIFGGYDMISN